MNKRLDEKVAGKQEKEKWVEFLYFAYKKAKYFVTRETSFVDKIEIRRFEEKLDSNIRGLAELLMDCDKLEDEVKSMNGYLYFFPKSFGPNKEPRIRPKVAFPFRYQVIWAAVILRIGEWFDTNMQLKNVYSMRDENLRNELEWMVNWSFNGRIKRLTTKKNEDLLESSYIQYNDSRFYESHQMALRKFHTYKSNVIQDLFEYNAKVYKGELDIHEFFPTLRKEKIEDMFKDRFEQLGKINCFNEKYFDTNAVNQIIGTLFKLNITFPDKIESNSPLEFVLKEYYNKLLKAKKDNNVESKEDTSEGIISGLLEILNKTLPLDLIASNFLSNSTLNHFVDRELKDVGAYILRYTDDYVVISSDKEKVKETICNIKEKLEAIDLSYSYDKTLPTTIGDIEEKFDVVKKTNDWNDKYSKEIKEWLNTEVYGKTDILLSKLKNKEKEELKTKSLMLGINIEPEEINRIDAGKKMTMSKLSTTFDIKLQALSDEELDMHMEELMVYMHANGDIGELKDETAKIFAAWRLNASHQEKTNRDQCQIDDVKDFLKTLEEAIKKYPYKLGFIDVYVLLLLKVIENGNTGLQELETFLLKLKPWMKESSEISGDKVNNPNKFISVCFPTVRIRVLNLMSRNWNRFNEDKRIELRVVLEKAFLDWYADPKVNWNELYTMYSIFFILRIRLPLGLCGAIENRPLLMLDLADAYNDYFFITEMKKVIGEESTESTEIAIQLLNEGLYWNRLERKLEFTEIDLLIYKKVKSELREIFQCPYSSLAFAKIAPEKLNHEDWSLLTNQWAEEKEDEFIFEVFDFLQLNIQSYFEEQKKSPGIMKWIEKDGEELENIYKHYVKDRFSAYQKIRNHFSMTDERFTPLVKNKINNLDQISIGDWVFYCQNLPYHLETSVSKQKVLHPLTEYEFVMLLGRISNRPRFNIKRVIREKGKFNNKKVICKKRKMLAFIAYKSHSLLFNLTMTPEDWKRFREDGEQVNSSKVTEEETKDYVKILFSLLTSRPWHTHIRKVFSKYKWNDLQSYFEMTYYPSTAVSSLFVNHLNIHQNFYAKLYNMPLEELPYRDIFTKEKSKDIIFWMKAYLKKQKDNQVYKNDNRKLELLEINIDQLRS